jgi:general secretion pathway protein D
MRFSWAKLALLATLATAVVAPFESAMAQQSAGVRIDLNLKDADMVSATNVLFMKTGLSFVIEPSTEPYKKITLKIDNVTAEEAVSYICKAAGAYFRRDEVGVYIISQQKPAEPTATGAPAAKQPKLLKRIKVLRSDSRDVYDMVMFGVPFNSNRGFEELKRFKNLTANDSNRIFGTDVRVVGGQAPSQTFGPAMGVVSGSARPVEASDISLPGDEAANQGRGGGFPGGGGGGVGGAGGFGGQNGGGIGGQTGGGIGGQNGGGQMVGGTGLVGESIDFISYDPTDNSLVVRGNEDDINQLQTYISLFDVAPKQVQIKVEFVTTTEQLERSFGTEFLYQRGTVFAGTRPGAFVRTGDPVFLNYATGNITARLRASLFEGSGRVVSAPILRTLNNQPASITSAIVTTIFVNSTTVTQGAVVTFANPQPLTATTALSVTPRINDDQTITMYLTPTVQNFAGVSVGPNGEEIPNQVQQFISVVARVKNNETIVLGGLTQKNDDLGQNRVPVLSEIPIIGQFFRSNTRRKTNSELLIFVTPSIIEDESTGNPGGP